MAAMQGAERQYACAEEGMVSAADWSSTCAASGPIAMMGPASREPRCAPPAAGAQGSPSVGWVRESGGGEVYSQATTDEAEPLQPAFRLPSWPPGLLRPGGGRSAAVTDTFRPGRLPDHMKLPIQFLISEQHQCGSMGVVNLHTRRRPVGPAWAIKPKHTSRCHDETGGHAKVGRNTQPLTFDGTIAVASFPCPKTP